MLKSLIKKLPPIASLLAERDALVKAGGFVPPGHFYSPIVSTEEARRDEQRIFGPVPRELPGIDMNERGQLEMLTAFEQLYPSIGFPETKTESHRYYYQNPAYGYSDAIMLHCMMRYLKPKRVIEIGSGYSSCVMLDTNEKHLGRSTSLTFIEPYPALLKSLVKPQDNQSIKIVESRLQDVSIDTFLELEAGDILFVDSTHVSKTGSDVNYLLFEILPRLASGVRIHVHDVFYPFEYPREWVMGGRSWNEIYALRAFLQHNSAFTIEMMNTFLTIFHRDRIAEHMPLCLKNSGGSIWMRRLG